MTVPYRIALPPVSPAPAHEQPLVYPSVARGLAAIWTARAETLGAGRYTPRCAGQADGLREAAIELLAMVERAEARLR